MFVTLRKVNDELLISYKRIVLKDDYIRQVLDIYHV
jgi:benzoate/toluate 1,2-dioxygenase beta subunit